MPVQSPTAPTADPEEGTPPRAGAGDPGGLEEDLKEELVQMYARRDHLADAAFAFLRGMPAAEHAALLERAAGRRDADARSAGEAMRVVLGDDDAGTKETVLLETGYTPGQLRAAASDGDVQRVEELLALGLNPRGPGEELASWAALPYAAQHGRTEICTALVERHGFRVLAQDQNHETALMQAAYLGHTETAAELERLEHAARGRGEEGATSEELLNALNRPFPAPRIVFATPPEKWAWDAPHSVSIICSAPEFSMRGDKVMVGLFAMCESFSEHTKFGYDWGGSVTAEAADTNPDRVVYSCCHSLSCTCLAQGTRVLWDVHGCCCAPVNPGRATCWCGKNGEVIKFGGVNWSRPESVAGSVCAPLSSCCCPSAASHAT
jgi:hypothetical protein